MWHRVIVVQGWLSGDRKSDESVHASWRDPLQFAPSAETLKANTSRPPPLSRQSKLPAAVSRALQTSTVLDRQSHESGCRRKRAGVALGFLAVTRNTGMCSGYTPVPCPCPDFDRRASPPRACCARPAMIRIPRALDLNPKCSVGSTHQCETPTTPAGHPDGSNPCAVPSLFEPSPRAYPPRGALQPTPITATTTAEKLAEPWTSVRHSSRRCQPALPAPTPSPSPSQAVRCQRPERLPLHVQLPQQQRRGHLLPLAATSLRRCSVGKPEDEAVEDTNGRGRGRKHREIEEACDNRGWGKG